MSKPKVKCYCHCCLPPHLVRMCQPPELFLCQFLWFLHFPDFSFQPQKMVLPTPKKSLNLPTGCPFPPIFLVGCVHHPFEPTRQPLSHPRFGPWLELVLTCLPPTSTLLSSQGGPCWEGAWEVGGGVGVGFERCFGLGGLVVG